MSLESLRSALTDRYRLERELGAGGMATVYLAQDLKHDRQVAIKVLRPELAAVIGAERFLSEIKTTANLQHPHILPLFDSGHVTADTRMEDGGSRVEGDSSIRHHPSSILYYVMPYVEGESLRDRLDREKQLPIADAVRIAGEVASALDYAHRHGVIHRDIKPENVMLHDGRALVADFGIALAVSTTTSTRMTETGMSLGTPHYMSPEQAMGERELDARTDVYALGCVLYEMLSGDPPFTGPTAQAIVARVMTDEPRSLVAQRRSVPDHVEQAVLTALEKLPADRFATAAAFAAALGEDGPRDPVGAPSGRRRAAALRHRARRRTVLVAAGVLAAAALGFLAGRGGGGSTALLTFGKATKVTWEPGLEILPAISPDGRSVAYGSGTVFQMQIFVRPVAGGRGVRLTDDSTGVQSHPRWSPDGTRILFLANGGVYSAPATGGPARAEVPVRASGAVITADYSPDGSSVVYAVGDSLFIRDPDGNSRHVAVVTDATACDWSPNGALIACGSGNALSLIVGDVFGNISPSRIVVVRPSGGRVISVSDSLTPNQAPIWSTDGEWLYYVSSRDGPRDIYAQRISGSGEPRGDLLRLTTGLGAHTISMSADGRKLAFASLSTESNIWSVSLAGSATPETMERITSGTQNVENVNISRDGRWLFYDSDLSGNMDVYRLSLATGVSERLTSDPSDEFAPVPSPDGREVVFHGWRGGSSRDIYVLPLDGGPVQRVTDTPEHEVLASWSPDGNALVFAEFTTNGGIWIARRTADGWGAPVRRTDFGHWVAWSPDGGSLAFTTLVSAGSLYRVPVDSGEPREVLRATTDVAADKAFWTPDGRSLLFRGSDAAGRRSLFVVPATGGTPREIALLDDEGGISLRGGWAYGRDRAYFSRIEQSSDITVLEVMP